MTREQITKDISALENIRESAIDQSWFGHEIDALTHAIEALRTRLERLDGPPPGHVRVAFSMFVGREGSYSTTERRAGDRHCVINVDLPLPEPAAEVEGEVE